MRIAVLLTTFNRKEKTLTCLRSLYKQILPDEISIDVYLTDDNSSDGTADAIKLNFPRIHLLHGNGNYYWAGGMRNSWRNALRGSYDFYLLLNDDTTLNPDAITRLLAYKSEGFDEHAVICIGNTCNEDGKITYGGKKLNSSLSVKSKFIYSSTSFTECDMGNANIMLIPQYVVKTIGILSNKFTHGIADYDYTLKARKAGIKVISAPGFLGICKHDHGNNWKGSKTKLKERLTFLRSPKGLAYGEYLSFTWNHFPVSYPAEFTKLWLKTLFPVLWDTFKR
jgi:GT2 family glycosyltransferase